MSRFQLRRHSGPSGSLLDDGASRNSQHRCHPYDQDSDASTTLPDDQHSGSRPSGETSEYTARQIFTIPGLSVFRPHKTLAGTIAISMLIFLHLFGLLVLAWYIYTFPTWRAKLDSFAITQWTKGVDIMIQSISARTFGKWRL